jgi:hypothetical protein
MIGQVVMLMMVDKIQPPYWVTDKVQEANSVKAKANCHANTELNSEVSDKGVQTRDLLSLVDKSIVGSLWKHNEMHRNDASTCNARGNSEWCHRHDFIPSRAWHCN